MHMTNVGSRERISYIDSLKGYAICLVVLGHLIQSWYCPGTSKGNIIFNYICAFHMPLFMLLSGFTTRTHENFSSLLDGIWRRSIALLLPFFAWGLTRAICFNGISISQQIYNPDCGLWFLWSLFFIYVCFHTCMFLGKSLFSNKHKYLFLLFGWIFLILIRVILDGKYGSSSIMYYFVYFSLGYILANSSIYDKIINNCKSILAICLICFLICGYIMYGTYHLSTLFSLKLSLKIMMYPIYSFIAICGCLASFSFFYIFDRHLKFLYLNQLGKITLGIYAVHFSILSYFHQTYNELIFPSVPLLNYVVSFLFVLLLSIAIVYIMSKTRITSILYLGKGYK